MSKWLQKSWWRKRLTRVKCLCGVGKVPEDTKTRAVTKRRQVLGGLLIALFLLVLLGHVLLHPAASSLPVRTSPSEAIVVKSSSDALQHWTVTSGAQLANVTQQLNQQHQQNDAHQRALHALEQRLSTQQRLFNERLQQRDHEAAQAREALRVEFTQALAQQRPPLSSAPAVSAAPSHTASAAKLAPSSSDADARAAGHASLPTPILATEAHQNQASSTATSAASLPAVAPVAPVEPLVALNAHESAASTERPRVTNPYEAWLPMGAFFKATLLNGVVAPTGVAGSNDPVPILMKVMDNAILPNGRWRYQLRGCFVMGTAYGSISSQRVAVRLARLSCLSGDGTALVTSALKGFVVDSDGKADLRGELVNRQGSKVAMASLAGLTQGVGNMLGNAQHGASLAGTPMAKLQAAGFEGANEAANTVAQFYVKQAEHIYPVIVINAGRNVTIDITQGVSLHWQDRAHADIPNDALPAEHPVEKRA